MKQEADVVVECRVKRVRILCGLLLLCIGCTAASAAPDDDRRVSVITARRAVIAAIPIFASETALLVWSAPEPFDAAHLEGRTTLLPVSDILAVEYTARGTFMRGALIGGGIGLVALGLPVTIAGGLENRSVGDIAMVGAAGAVLGGVIGGLLTASSQRSAIIDIGASKTRYLRALPELRSLCVYQDAAPPPVLRLMQK